ncbi:MAG: hypothetical protein RI935_651 [Candidatus Parcubacteria bacterium]|jgi:hypothetical protein
MFNLFNEPKKPKNPVPAADTNAPKTTETTSPVGAVSQQSKTPQAPTVTPVPVVDTLTPSQPQSPEVTPPPGNVVSRRMILRGLSGVLAMGPGVAYAGDTGDRILKDVAAVLINQQAGGRVLVRKPDGSIGTDERGIHEAIVRQIEAQKRAQQEAAFRGEMQKAAEFFNHEGIVIDDSDPKYFRIYNKNRPHSGDEKGLGGIWLKKEVEGETFNYSNIRIRQVGPANFLMRFEVKNINNGPRQEYEAPLTYNSDNGRLQALNGFKFIQELK